MVKLILCLKRKGRILEGYDADLCILDQDLQLTDVIVRGKIQNFLTWSLYEGCSVFGAALYGARKEK